MLGVSLKAENQLSLAVSDKLEIKNLITTDNFMAQFIVCGLAEDKRDLIQLLIVANKISESAATTFLPRYSSFDLQETLLLLR